MNYYFSYVGNSEFDTRTEDVAARLLLFSFKDISIFLQYVCLE